MRFHVLRSLANYLNTQRIDAFHATMYHGTADRGGKKPTCRNAQLANPLDRPLQIHKNAYRIAHVFEPEGALVVSSVVRNALCKIPGITLAPVAFKTLFTYPFDEGDFSFWERMPDYYAQQDFIDGQVNDQTLHGQVGDYFELVAPTVGELRKQFSGLINVTVEVAPTDGDAETIPISRELLLANPVYACGGMVMADSIFSELESFVDWTYFVHGEGSI